MSGIKSLRFGPIAAAERALRRAALVRAAADRAAARAEAPPPSPPKDQPAALSACLRRAEQALAFPRACDVAGVPLAAEIATVRRDVEAFVERPNAARIDAVDALLPRLRARYLEMQLDARRARLLDALDTLREPSWAQALEEWRPGLAIELQSLRQAIDRDGWTAAARPLNDLDALLRARALARVELLCQGGEAAGFRATPPVFDPARRAYVAELHDAHGLLARIAEEHVEWTALAGDDRVEVRGPREWDGPACVHGGYAEWLRALAAQGVDAQLHGEDGAPLPLPFAARPTTEEAIEMVAATPARGGHGAA